MIRPLLVLACTLMGCREQAPVAAKSPPVVATSAPSSSMSATTEASAPPSQNITAVAALEKAADAIVSAADCESALARYTELTKAPVIATPELSAAIEHDAVLEGRRQKALQAIVGRVAACKQPKKKA